MPALLAPERKPPLGDPPLGSTLGAMSLQTRLGLAVIGCAVALGALGDALFQGQSLGANVPLWAAVFILVLAGLMTFGRVPWHRGRRWMLGPLLLFSLLFVWHDSPL